MGKMATDTKRMEYLMMMMMVVGVNGRNLVKRGNRLHFTIKHRLDSSKR